MKNCKAIQISKNVYWVGAADWSMRNFHGYETSRDSTYNAYLLRVANLPTIQHLDNITTKIFALNL